MGISLSIVLIAIGAVLAWAVSADVSRETGRGGSAQTTIVKEDRT